MSKSKVTRNPLRKIVGFDGPRMLLECGHYAYPASMYGIAPMYRARCWKCRLGRPEEWTH
ncbi:hypothetical protein LCGC14_1575780 [marine sediment metagenome]|uniref:Uncharacterized protein n=1 Tax=marine sediment metagenome TaxID=412755 RepID=A0A0F9LIM5_9ZZZZ